MKNNPLIDYDKITSTQALEKIVEHNKQTKEEQIKAAKEMFELKTNRIISAILLVWLAAAVGLSQLFINLLQTLN